MLWIWMVLSCFFFRLCLYNLYFFYTTKSVLLSAQEQTEAGQEKEARDKVMVKMSRFYWIIFVVSSSALHKINNAKTSSRPWDGDRLVSAAHNTRLNGNRKNYIKWNIFKCVLYRLHVWSSWLMQVCSILIDITLQK